MENWNKKTWKFIGIGFVVFNIFLTGLVAFTVNALSSREEALQGSASVAYVNKQDTEIKTDLTKNITEQKVYIDKQDGLIIDRVGRVQDLVNAKSDKTDVAAMRQTVDNMFSVILQMATAKEIKRAGIVIDSTNY